MTVRQQIMDLLGQFEGSDARSRDENREQFITALLSLMQAPLSANAPAALRSRRPTAAVGHKPTTTEPLAREAGIVVQSHEQR